MQAPGNSPMLLAIYQPWWGNHEHINVGYSCHDPGVLRQQIAKARELNIGGFVVNWYGPRKEYEDETYGLLQQHSKADVRDWVYQLIGQGVLLQVGTEYPLLKLNTDCRLRE